MSDVIVTEPLPCPFCSRTDIRIVRHSGAGRGYHVGEDLFSIGCYGCGGSVPSRYSQELVVSAWNVRPKA